MLIDPEKLKRVRALIDERVAELHVACDVPRTAARSLLANELGYELFGQQQGGWWYATAVAFEEQQRLTDESQTAEEATRDEMELRTQRHCQAASRDLAETAVLCRILDLRVDLFMHDERRQVYYPTTIQGEPDDVWGPVVAGQWAQAPRKGPHQKSPDNLWSLQAGDRVAD